MQKMRAAQMIDVGVMACEEIPLPQIGPGEVLVQTEMASICGSDLHVVMMGAGVAHPRPCPHGYPGHEGIGTVVESRSDALPVGSRVLTCPSPFEGECFNEYQRIGAEFCVPLPNSNLPASHLLMAQQFGTVMYAMNVAPRDLRDRTAVVLGQGSAGLFWTWLCKQAGAARVIATDLSQPRLEVSKQYGADVCVDAGRDDPVTVVNDLTGGVGADFVVEAVGRADVLQQSIDVVRQDGELMWFGLPSTDDNIPLNYQSFFRKRIKASSTYGAQYEANGASFREALRIIADGDLDVSPLPSHTLSIEQITQAMELAHSPLESGALKVSLSFD